ncbi:MAG: hypothetical protein COS76_03830 [Candidatus Portnoybacteria bacterium CG06_land_8_20_14_3_00_39_12]|uniref:dolichyl-phosphate beta-glucosyltransferase n=3 Tax=Candidatus Portnoyibacteriota TaxID=1817913 RepID=A0A2M8KFT8_9BACT|nr:MAG: hypothetical protein AUJ33_03185 [Parcubacteria group bacterium CG1_02_40_25]PIU74864.1 MAG: hypothetical protein COS76_03830 [Candidatus Portnoybacteria bacterium CG06_land_8_20_14_3_00_39_12]PIZ71185.1 MAG: hypothetical protein COY09_01135 [Candidatus Portnoybacteria bacterium CG_4_10_14_0_2_um_filter_39_11]PJE58788.1 MAG: hypothetical protein COU83_01910 [Candidatus Portnoybacteria bacterium CG10_big_fil_rev_8_21_14_0_10_40_22]
MYLSVILPAYNEAKRIAQTLLDIDRYLSRQNYEYEIIVVDDGSRDNTVKVSQQMQSVIKNLKVIDNPQNHGKGYVVKQAMLKAKGKYRLFMDADNSTVIGHLDKFFPWIEKGYQVVIGSIEVKGAKIEERAAWYRRWLGHLAKLLIRAVLIWGVHDTQRGFKLFSEEVAEAVFPKQTIIRWGFDMEILLIAKKMGYKIKEVAVDWHNPEGSKVTLSAYFKTLVELFKIRWNSLAGKYKG